jgi:hypothetical protein
MNIIHLIAQTLLALPLFTTPVSAQTPNPVMYGYGQKDVKICYQKKDMEVKSSQLASYLAKGATVGKCPQKKGK